MNNLSCQRGILDCGDGRNDRRDRKNDVLMTSNFKPEIRQAGSACGTFGLSM